MRREPAIRVPHTLARDPGSGAHRAQARPPFELPKRDHNLGAAHAVAGIRFSRRITTHSLPNL